MRTWIGIEGWFEHDDAKLYRGVAAQAQPGDVYVELGCFLGRSTALMAELLKGKGAEFYVYDNFVGSRSSPTATPVFDRKVAAAGGVNFRPTFEENMRACGFVEGVDYHAFKEWSDKAARLHKAKSVDFCFIDTDHEYTAVVKDIKAWWPKIKSGGILSGHDYIAPPGVHFPGVRRAVHELVAKHGLKLSVTGTCWAVKKP